MKEPFNPQEWLNKPSVNSEQRSVGSGNPSNPSNNSNVSNLSNPSSGLPSPVSGPPSPSEVDTIITRIEAELTDITTSYTDWLNVGFAFAHEFGEAGRSFYHRVSRFYPGYTKADTDKQYDQCLRSQGHGITISTFFYLAKQAGVEVRGRGDDGVMGRHGEGMRESGSEGERARWDDGTMERENRKNEDNDQMAVGSGDNFTPSSNHSFIPSSPHPLVPSSPRSLVPSEEEDPSEEVLPTLPDDIFEQLPRFFREAVTLAVSKEERDILFLGALATVSACLSQFSGIYDGRKVYPNLYFYLTAKASAGKGRLILCRNLVNLIHWQKRKESQQAEQQYEMEMREFNAVKSKDFDSPKPEKPRVKMLFIPANNSTTGFFQILSDNDGHGLIFETEGDTIAQAFKTDYGNFSDGFRKAFHHESISYYRRTDREYVEIDCPCVSTVISSTLGQMLNLIPSVENGLASRFMFYFMNLQPVWKDVFANNSDKVLEEHFNNLGREFYSLYNNLKENEGMEFSLSQQQQEAFNVFFTQVQDKYLLLKGMDYISIIRRLGLIAYRIMMVLTAMRIPDTGDFSVKQECSEEDFHSTLLIIKTLVRHASHVFSQLPEEVKPEKRLNRKEKFLEALPEKFTRKEFVLLARSLEIAERTADKYVAAFCDKGLLLREQPNIYSKITDQ